MDCVICQKHENFNLFTGPVLCEKSGMTLTHYPHMNEEKAVKGHLLIEPNRHILTPEEMTQDESHALGELIALGEKLIKQKLGAEHVYVFRINDKVPHLHFHLIPRYPQTPREFWGLKISEYNARLATLELFDIAKVCATLMRDE